MTSVNLAKSAQERATSPHGDGAAGDERTPPVRVDFWRAIRRHWVLALLPVILLAGAAVAAVYVRAPVYKAQTKLAAGRLDASAPEALAGFTGASQSLAETYSRSIRGDAVVKQVAAETGYSRDFVKSRLSAAPIPETPVFTVSATADAAKTAIQLSVLASRALEDDVARVGSSTPNADAVLREYQRASTNKAAAEIAVGNAHHAYRKDRTRENQQRVIEAEAELASTAAKVDAARTAYVAGRQGQGSVALVHIIERATTAGSDRDNVLQLWVFGAVLAGLGLGFALAYAQAHRLARKAAA